MQKKTNAKTIFIYTISIILILTTLVCFILLGMDVLYNKIFYEITKKYGRDAANEWLELVWNGSLYMHDAPSSSYMPYC